MKVLRALTNVRLILTIIIINKILSFLYYIALLKPFWT